MRLTLPLAALVVVLLAAYATAPPVALAEAAPVVAVAQADTSWGWPDQPANLQVLPADIGADGLRNVMRGFTRALGVRCQFCHVGEEGADFLTWDFPSDANPNKAIARDMMRMTWALNQETLPAIEGLSEAEGMRVTCFTCHRGDTTPATAP